MSEWLDWLTDWLLDWRPHVFTWFPHDGQVKSKVKENQVQDQDQIETAKIHWSKKKKPGSRQKKTKKYEKNGTPKGMFGGKVLTGLRVKKSQAQDLTRCLGNSYSHRIRRHQKDIATGGAFPLRFPPQGIQTIDLSHWNCCVEWSLSCFVLAWNGVLLLPSFLGLIVYQNANLNNYE